MAAVMSATFKILAEGYVKKGGESVASTVSLVQDKNINLIVDPGLVKDRLDIVGALEKEGLTPNAINYVFITHHHPDHTINVGMFPNAKVIDYASIFKDDYWGEHKETYELTPNIKSIQTPGHTMEDASLLVETNEGTVAFTHAWWHEDLTPQDDPLAEDKKLLEQSRGKILDLADFIVTSHGGLRKLR